MKDETIIEKESQTTITNDEFIIFKNAFQAYSKNLIQAFNKIIKKHEDLNNNSIYENQTINNNLLKTNRNNNEPLKQIINGNETDLFGNPNLKIIDKNTILYSGKVFKLYPGLTIEIKSTYRCQYYHKEEKKLQDA